MAKQATDGQNDWWPRLKDWLSVPIVILAIAFLVWLFSFDIIK